MPIDYSTALVTELQRAAERVIDDVAKDGLVVLKTVLDDAGFGESKYLKDYKIFAHVIKDEVIFEIILDVHSVVLDDVSKESSEQVSMDELIRKRARTYSMQGLNDIQRIEGMKDVRKDARKPARDARKKLQDSGRQNYDARKNSTDRLIDHQLAAHSPRGMKIDRDGKLAISFRKSMKTGTHSTVYPKGKFEGILDKFVRKLESVVVDKFVPELEHMINRYANG